MITVSGGGACHHIEWRCGPVITVILVLKWYICQLSSKRSWYETPWQCNVIPTLLVWNVPFYVGWLNSNRCVSFRMVIDPYSTRHTLLVHGCPTHNMCILCKLGNPALL